jgi:hypothetical protein
LVPTIIKEGYPIDSYYLLESVGIFQTQDEINNSPFQNITTKPGYLKYKNQNDDEAIDANDRIITGGAIPDYTFDFSINLSYKNWSLNSFSMVSWEFILIRKELSQRHSGLALR